MSSSSAAAAAAASSGVQCHYDTLGIPRDADATMIKKAYRKLALKYHPDKNITTTTGASTTVESTTTTSTTTSTPNTSTNLEQLFLQVQQAYECLSDSAERKWYDDHRDAILKGWSVSTSTSTTTTSTYNASNNNNNSTNDPTNDFLFNVAPYMYAGCYDGFNDDTHNNNYSSNNFYHVYSKVFVQIYQGELDGSSKIADVEYLNVPFGTSTSKYETVVLKFYQAWESFSSILSFAWADQWNVHECGEQRRVRRAMEEDNVRARKRARKVRNDDIAALIRFIKRRDPRIIAKRDEMEQLRVLRDYELKELTKQRKVDKEMAHREWKAQAEREALAMEKDDRINGRVRLADLEDDYDYYGGGKKKRGKGKKNKKSNRSYSPNNDDTDNEEQPDPESIPNESNTNDHVATEEQQQQHESIPPSEFDPSSGSQEGVIPTPPENESTIPVVWTEQLPQLEELTITDPEVVEVLDSSKQKWYCECCAETFLNSNDMRKHWTSKKHKDTAATRKSTMTGSTQCTTINDNGTTTTSSTKRTKQKLKRKKKGLLSEDGDVDENVSATEQNSKNVSLDRPPPLDDDASHTDVDDDDDNDDDNDDDDDDVAVRNRNRYDDEPLYWRCECCQKDFQSEGQMINHMNSKKHKASYRKYEKEVGKKLLYEVVEELHPIGVVGTTTTTESDIAATTKT